MSDIKTISALDEDDMWKQVKADLLQKDVFNYSVALQHGSIIVNLTIDIDLGGGFEGGYEMTSLTSVIATSNNFKFCIHKENFFDEIGKFFGMQDVIIGDVDFDKHVLVKSNNEEYVKLLFANASTRDFFIAIEDDFTFGITSNDDKKELELVIETGINDAVRLQIIYHHFVSFLKKLDSLHPMHTV